MNIILCIDLEATCGVDWPLEAMECIEIGVLAVDEDGKAIEQFKSLVQPQFSEVTAFCTSITTLTPALVFEAPSLSEVVLRLREWLGGLPSYPVAWCSWGAYDAKQWAQDLSRLEIADPLPRHFNAKQYFQKNFMKKGRQVGMDKALELAGLDYQGQRHRALEDAYNLSRLIPCFYNNKNNPETRQS